MNYLRTSDDIIKFCTENSILPISIYDISTYIEGNFGLSFLGYFYSMLDDSFFTYTKRGGHVAQENKFLATLEVLDFLFSSKVFSDSSGEMIKAKSDTYSRDKNKIVKLFGKMESGKITEIFAFNTGDYWETAFFNRENAKSVDLWF